MDTRRRRKPFKVDLTLKPEDKAAYDAFLADRRNTLEMAVAWLKERGYGLSWGAVFRHRQRFLDNLQDVQTWAQVALQFSEAARVSRQTDVFARGISGRARHRLTSRGTRRARNRQMSQHPRKTAHLSSGHRPVHPP